MDLYKQAVLRFRYVRLKRFLGSLFYSWQRDRLERKYRPKNPPETPQKPEKCLQAESTERGGYFKFEGAELEIRFLTPDFVQIDWKPGKIPIAYGIACKDWPTVETTFEQGENQWSVSSNTLQILVSQEGSLTFKTLDGQLIREEYPPQRKGEEWLHQAKLQPCEHIYGLGERAAPLNLRTAPKSEKEARSYRMWNYDMGGKYGPGADPLYLCIPVYLGLHSGGSYLIFYENTYSGNFSFKEEARAQFDGGALRYYLAIGSIKQVVERYTQLTGCPVLPPRWAFGYHQSRWGFETEEVVRQVAQGFITHNLPLSAIHLDIDCLDDFRAFTIDPDRFPKIREFTQELKDKGVRLIIIINPGVKPHRDNKLFEEGITQEIFCKTQDNKLIFAPVWPGMCAFPDFTDPLARHWWSRQYEYLLDLGFAGFWHDMNEPGVFTLWGDSTLPPHATQHAMEGRGGNHLEAHNIYGLLQARAGYEALRDYQVNHRPFIVSRAGWAGLQRYAWTWTGDIDSTWEALGQTIPTVLNMGLSGIPYSGPDIGGFKGDPSPELYLRWFQLACFLPFCRTHSANNVKPRTPWSYGEPILSIARDFLQLRYRLIPYFYTLAWEATQTGDPIVRPLFWLDVDDQRLWDVEDAFLVGNALMVCPVVKEGMRSRSVVLPKGRWYHFWDDRVIENCPEVELDAPLTGIPLLVRAGNILPMETDQELTLHIYPPVEGTCENYLYSDEGDGYGDWRIDRFCLKRDQGELELTRLEQGEFNFPYSKIELCLHGMKLQQVWIDGEEIKNFSEKQLICSPFQKIRLVGDLL
ncbi:Alpha-glucosidase [Gloeothece citriformis PCC 7424]|uniref:Alpha-glucosidase n=1 Tax=Gloeothece citriformis (strain PCC 7424) TaxID=65393 RepID=B7KDN2_GLOC7|nr:glycoside hydrolase family 31 protein [Gloeothece citriformis]ACK70334.1 Alpha-glucosidase [Gloeothece citriformis PCC 7424]